MPPTRTIPPAKAVKTERTHEENQERAYIAASRRSDRSLEARVESARRASETHKRRTGRSLRITEQDVINEEMYEEDDDDLPMQYRRLTAHLQTGSADLNRRLAAYLTSQVAMRTAMDHMINRSDPPYENPQYSQQTPATFQSPILSQNVNHSPMSPYSQAPVLSPHHPGYRNTHSRAYSTGQQTPSESGLSRPFDHRTFSTPAAIHPFTSSHSLNTDGATADADYSPQTQSATLPNGHFPPFHQNIHPFTTSLPPEAQQMLGPALDPNDPFQAMLMTGSEDYTDSFYYPWGNMSHGIDGMPVHPSAWKGMSATLAPSALASHLEYQSSATISNNTLGPATATTKMTAPYSKVDFNFSKETAKDLQSSNLYSMSRDDSHQGSNSGQATPGEAVWDNFVRDGSWSEETTAQ